MAHDLKDLTREAWLKAGQDLLRDAGLRALRLHPLAKALNISTGSFYHHFASFDAFLGQLCAYYSGEQLDRNLADIRAQGGAPMEQLQSASTMATTRNLRKLALAMRAWAQSDERARKAVRAVDKKLTVFFAQCLEGMGFAPEDATVRAYLLIAAASLDDFPWPSKLAAADRNNRLLAAICGTPLSAI
ncbi:MAG TPA: TetR/AcrR family transcriptional regulator [Parvibaculum sp.]|jgi:AcrR family transcriptional regulator